MWVLGAEIVWFRSSPFLLVFLVFRSQTALSSSGNLRKAPVALIPFNNAKRANGMMMLHKMGSAIRVMSV